MTDHIGTSSTVEVARGVAEIQARLAKGDVLFDASEVEVLLSAITAERAAHEDAAKWLAVTLGCESDWQSIQTRVESVWSERQSELATVTAKVWEQAIEVAQQSVKNSISADLDVAAAEILIKRLEAAARAAKGNSQPTSEHMGSGPSPESGSVQHDPEGLD